MPARGWRPLAADDWLLVHCVHLDRPLPRHDRPQPTIEHEQRRRLRRAHRLGANPIVLGTDGIGADMLEEARLAYVRLREHDVSASPDTVWSWLDEGYRFFPECRDDRVEFNYDHADSAWHTAFTPGVRAIDGHARFRRGRACATAGRRASISTKSAPRPPSMPLDCSPDCEGTSTR